MKKLLVTLSLLVFYCCSFSQDTVRLIHKNYTSVYSKSKSYPVSVEWWVTKKQVSCPTPVKRVDKFVPDPLLPNETNLAIYYKGSGFDRGHMSPAADNLCDGELVMSESFYFSNMSPQYHSLNAGDWKSLETHTRELALKHDSIRVWCGNIGEVRKIGRLSIPEKCWKVVYIKSQNKYHYFVFNNDKTKPDGMSNNEISKQEFEKIVKLKLSIQ
jgi:endonuclease G